MRRHAAAIAVAVSLLAPAVHAQQARDVKKVLHDVANSLGMLRSVQELDSVMTVEYWGTGTMQAGGAPVQLKTYHVQLAYDFPAMRVEIERAAGTPAKEIQVVSGTYAWNEDKMGAGLDPSWGTASPAMEAVADRLLRLWTTPMGVVKAATAAGDQTKVTTENGATVLTFPLANGRMEQTSYVVVGPLAGTPVKVTLDRDDRPARVEARYRGRTYVTTYSGYADLNDADYKADIFLPARIVQTVDGQNTFDITVRRSNTYNPYVIAPVPESVQKNATR